MSKFYVGQRVRKVAHLNGADLKRYGGTFNVPIGSLATVVQFWGENIGVIYDDYPSDHSTRQYADLPYQLAPIYDGDQPAAFDASIWQPNHNTVLAGDVGDPTFTLAELVAIDKQRVANGR